MNPNVTSNFKQLSHPLVFIFLDCIFLLLGGRPLRPLEVVQSLCEIRLQPLSLQFPLPDHHNHHHYHPHDRNLGDHPLHWRNCKYLNSQLFSQWLVSMVNSRYNFYKYTYTSKDTVLTILQDFLHIGANICGKPLELRLTSTRPVLIRVAVPLHPAPALWNNVFLHLVEFDPPCAVVYNLQTR